eukprot:705470-Prymnesium_polylepis.1
MVIRSPPHLDAAPLVLPSPRTRSDLLLHDRVGTKSYMSPEVYVLGEPYDGHALDVWALGVILFSLAAGFFPFDRAKASDSRFVQAQRAQQAGQSTSLRLFAMYNRPCPFPPPMYELIDSMLLIDRAARATLPAVAQHPWLEAAMPEPIAAAPPSPPRAAP